ncbi:zf-TFIIB domain-containing protein [Micromonospora sp. WMMD812]|uniref:TFIIB-type zinc ribbon-containing protein n=1 Tax=Micromonospora sp. WMMD812 TaxID=3015152 RepID=UPI00248A978D|nr:zf-TFIIB domain-containing protein [Micromonospora sp. WMMD812]WBB65811.1 zf-TFIIB domain-containing protein [Micromonospora sp. WMMD812]
MMSLTCPKCHGEMRQYERSGVVIDQCGECRGIFLDRGELEKLFEAEANWNRQQASGPAAQPAHQPGGYPPPAPAPHQPGYGAVPPPPPPPPAHGYPPAPAPAYGHGQQHHGYHGHYRRKKHKSFLDEMFG